MRCVRWRAPSTALKVTDRCRRRSALAPLYLLVCPQTRHNFDIDAVGHAGPDLAFYERLRGGLDLHERAVILDDQIALIDGERILLPVENDIRIGAVVGTQKHILAQLHGGANG